MAHTRFFGLNAAGLDAFEELRLQRAFAYYGIPAIDAAPHPQPAVQQPAPAPITQSAHALNAPRPRAR